MSKVEVKPVIVYDPLKTLAIIENDVDLLNIFQDDVKIEFPVLRLMVQTGPLPNHIEDLLESIFSSIILSKQRYIEEYSNIQTASVGHKKRKALPRRYGKVQILADIKKSGSKPTDLQRAMLAINELRNLYVSVSNKCITDYFNEKKKLSDAECREITAAVDNIKKKMKLTIKK